VKASGYKSNANLPWGPNFSGLPDSNSNCIPLTVLTTNKEFMNHGQRE